jgi:hypothetical protein
MEDLSTMDPKMSHQEYVKHFYWINAEQIDAILEYVKRSLHAPSIPHARQRPCEALNPTFPVMHVPPEVWSANCYRQASWFRTSDLKDGHLIVANTALTIPDAILSGRITKIMQSQVPADSRQMYLPLLTSPEFVRRAPAEWFHLLDREIPIFKSFLDRIDAHIELDEFLERHSANHAHFLQPVENLLVTIEHEHERIPCSLFPSEFICSACMELFGVIGPHLPKKALKNCPGLKYAPLGAGEYFLVEIPDG